MILTGTGSDGTLGVKDIKANGGVVIVQDPNDAEYDGMPQSAIATGLADFILAGSRKFRRPFCVSPAPRRASRFPRRTRRSRQDERSLLQKIFAQLRARTDRDFSRYKRSTVLRRIARRMQLNYIEDLQAYLERLRERPEEVRALADDLLITVTHFFRDPEVFERLEKEVMPRLFAKEGTAGQRPGLVGGMRHRRRGVLAGHPAGGAGRAGWKRRRMIQIFASDLHAPLARKGARGVLPGRHRGGCHVRSG